MGGTGGVSVTSGVQTTHLSYLTLAQHFPILDYFLQEACINVPAVQRGININHPFRDTVQLTRRDV